MVEQQIDEPINNVPFTLADFSADKSALTVAALSMSLFMSAIVGHSADVLCVGREYFCRSDLSPYKSANHCLFLNPDLFFVQSGFY